MNIDIVKNLNLDKKDQVKLVNFVMQYLVISLCQHKKRV